MTERHLCVFLDRLDGGGAERVLVTIANALSERHRVDLVVACEGGVLEDLVDSKVRFIRLRAARTAQSLPALVRYLRSSRPEALLTGKVNANGIAAMAGKIARTGTRIVISEHSLVRTSKRATRIKEVTEPAMIRWLYPRADHLVAVSPSAAEEVARTARLPASAVQVIPNPVIDRDFTLRASEEVPHPFSGSQEPLIVAMGRLEPIKGFDDLLRAMAPLQDLCPARLVILGDGSERQSLEKLVDELGLADRVSLPGFSANPLPLLRAADLFCMSSHSESLGNVMIEALAVGTPVLARNAPGGPQHILSGTLPDCLIDDFSPGALARALHAALSSPPRIDGLSLEQYRTDTVVRAYEQALLP